MKKLFSLPALFALTIFCSCQKHQTEAERNAEVERQVQQRLAAEHQTEEQQRLAEREAEVAAREKALSENQNTSVATQQAVEQTQPAERPGQRASSGSATRRTQESSDSDSESTGSYSTFYTKLEPHGVWRETSDYGYVWQPREAEQSRTWRPYTNGRWVYSDAGWTWVSEEPFGWATYHYGRWTRLRNVGWVWVPGSQWAPAWVSWRKSNDYVGWAPLPPEARFDRRSGIHNWADNYYDIGPDQYSFVPTNQFGAQRVEQTVVPVERNVTIVNQTTNVTNITYSNTTVINQGPNYDELRTRTQQPIERLRIERETNFNGEPQSVVRGNVIFMPAPLVARAQAVERPRAVKETIGQVVVDHGWEGIGNRQAAEQVRAKMRSEATPPPNAPSKTFVKPAQVPTESNRASATPAPSATATAVPAATAQPTFPARASATPEPSVSVTPPRPTPARRQMPKESLSTTSSPAQQATAGTPSATAPLASPPPASTPAATPRESIASTPRPAFTPRKLATPTPAPSVSVAAEASATPSVSSTAASSNPTFGRAAEKDQPKAERQLRRQGRAGEAIEQTAAPTNSLSPSAAASANPDAATSPSVSDKRESRKEERRKQRRAGDSGETASPSPSLPPQ